MKSLHLQYEWQQMCLLHAELSAHRFLAQEVPFRRNNNDHHLGGEGNLLPILTRQGGVL